MKRLEQAHERRAKVRRYEERLEHFVDRYIKETSEQSSLVITTTLEYSFSALLTLVDSPEKAAETVNQIYKALCAKHKLNIPPERSTPGQHVRAAMVGAGQIVRVIDQGQQARAAKP